MNSGEPLEIDELGDDLAAADDGLRTVDGRLPGPRGRETRNRLLEVTADMLRSGSYRDLAVVEIAREAGVSPATFYQYFPDVETAIFFMADHIVVAGSVRLADLVEALEVSGDDEIAMASARALADGFLEFWREYFSILRVLDLGSAEKDSRFQQRRTQLLSGPTEAIAKVLTAQQDRGVITHDIDPRAMAAVLTSMLSHVAAHRPGLREWGVARGDLVEAMARLLYWAFLDRSPAT